MYVPEPFRQQDPQALHDLVRRFPFATLVTGGAAPEVTHLPLLLDTDDDGARLRGHMARANPHWQELAAGTTVVAIFQGPHAYVSPRFYAGVGAVPTWNYAVVHAHGGARLLDSGELAAALDDLVARHEPADGGWSFSGDEARYAHMLDAIVGFEIRVRRWEGKFKLNQNRPRADRDGVVAALARSRHQCERWVAELMRSDLEGLP